MPSILNTASAPQFSTYPIRIRRWRNAESRRAARFQAAPRLLLLVRSRLAQVGNVALARVVTITHFTGVDLRALNLGRFKYAKFKISDDIAARTINVNGYLEHPLCIAASSVFVRGCSSLQFLDSICLPIAYLHS